MSIYSASSSFELAIISAVIRQQQTRICRVETTEANIRLSFFIRWEEIHVSSEVYRKKNVNALPKFENFSNILFVRGIRTPSMQHQCVQTKKHREELACSKWLVKECLDYGKLPICKNWLDIGSDGKRLFKTIFKPVFLIYKTIISTHYIYI